MMQFNPAQKTGWGGVMPPDPPPRTEAKEAHLVSGGDAFSFRDLLDIVNPLQHMPVIGTLYRAITGDRMGSLERIAGDTLYGGLWGAVSSLADTAFEAVTGKDLGDTVLALFTGGKDETPKAAAVRTQQVPAPPGAGMTALSDALAAKGIDGDLARRALFAYQKSMQLPALTD